MKKNKMKISTKEIVNDLLGYKKVYRERDITCVPGEADDSLVQYFNKRLPGFVGACMCWNTIRQAKAFYKKKNQKCPELDLVYCREGVFK